MNKKFVLVAVLLLLPALLLAGCSLPFPSLRGTSLQPAVSEATAQPTTQPAASQAGAQPTTQVSEAEPVLEANQVLDVLQNTLTQIYDQVNPSVVNIHVSVNSSGQSFQMPSFPGMPSIPEGQIPRQEGLASGFVWDTDGYIVTNNHVVKDADQITVTFYDGTTVPAKVVGTDVNSDLAVIKVDVPASQLDPVQVADSTAAKVGQLAVAIGNPYGLEGTMTVGFISALGRSLPVDSTSLVGTYTIPDIIQTDAPINPGNSGGVLVDDQGQLIGVPTAIESATGSNSGIGFAVPSSIVQKVVPALIDKGAVQYSWVGITGTTLTADLAEAMDLNRDQRGALVISITAGSPAEKAGLRGSDVQVTLNGEQAEVGGDVIVSINDQPVKEFDDLVSYLVGSTSVGDKVTLTILRDGKEQTVDVTLAARPETQTQAQTQGPLSQATPPAQQQPDQGTGTGGWLGIQGMTLTSEIAQAMDLSSDQEGVLVVVVTPNSPAEKAGLRGSSQAVQINGQQLQVGGDVIVAVDGQSVSRIEELQAIVREARPGQQVTLTILRDGRERTIDVTLGQRPATNP
jgi:serine protease Do